MLVGTALSVLAAPAPVSILVVARSSHPPSPCSPTRCGGTLRALCSRCSRSGHAPRSRRRPPPSATCCWSAVRACCSGWPSPPSSASSRAAMPMRRRRSRQPVGPIAGEMAASVGVAIVGAGFAGLLIMDSHWYWAAVGAVAAVSGPQPERPGDPRHPAPRRHPSRRARRGGDPRDRSAAARRHRARGHAAGRRRAVRRPATTASRWCSSPHSRCSWCTSPRPPPSTCSFRTARSRP